MTYLALNSAKRPNWIYFLDFYKLMLVVVEGRCRVIHNEIRNIIVGNAESKIVPRGPVFVAAGLPATQIWSVQKSQFPKLVRPPSTPGIFCGPIERRTPISV